MIWLGQVRIRVYTLLLFCYYYFKVPPGIWERGQWRVVVHLNHFRICSNHFQIRSNHRFDATFSKFVRQPKIFVCDVFWATSSKVLDFGKIVYDCRNLHFESFFTDLKKQQQMTRLEAAVHLLPDVGDLSLLSHTYNIILNQL